MPRIVTYCRVAAHDPARPPDAHEPELRALVWQCSHHVQVHVMATHFWAVQLVSGQIWLVRGHLDRARPEPCTAAPPEPSPRCELASFEARMQLG